MLDSKILQKIHQTEKAVGSEKNGKYIFVINLPYNKIQIRKEVERLFKVKVKDVNMIHLPPKKRKISRQVGYESGYDKAIVTLEKGYKINEKI